MIAVQAKPGAVYWMRFEGGALQALCGSVDYRNDRTPGAHPYPLRFAAYGAAKAWGRTYEGREKIEWRPAAEVDQLRPIFDEATTERVVTAIFNGKPEVEL